MDRLTLLDDGKAVELAAHIDGNSVRIRPDDVQRALGWELRPDGLCKHSVCIPVRDAADLRTSSGVDLAALAQLLGRPLALDAEERTAYLAASATERGAQLATLVAPAFTLPDLSGRPHSLSDYRGKKILLIAYASW
jgi:hypothetical protein